MFLHKIITKGKDSRKELPPSQRDFLRAGGVPYLNLDVTENLRILDFYFREQTFAKFFEIANQIITLWQDHSSDSIVPNEILRRIGYFCFSAEKLKLAQAFFGQALEAEPNNPSNIIAMSEISIRAGRFDEARDMLERSFQLRPDIHTASKFAEISFFLGAPADDIFKVISPYISQALQEPKPRYAHGIVLALMISTQEEGVRSQTIKFISDRNGFSDPESNLAKINQASLKLIDRRAIGDVLYVKKSYGKEIARDERKISREEALVLSAFRGMGGVFNSSFKMSPVNNATARVAGGSAAIAYRKT